MLRRWRKLRHSFLARTPYSRVRGVRWVARGEGEHWVVASERLAARMDVAVGLLLLASAAMGLAALYWSSSWLAAGAGLALAGAMFAMAGTMWVDRQIQVVLDHIHLGGARRHLDSSWTSDG